MIERSRMVKYERPLGITRMHIFLACCYLFGTHIYGSNFVPEDKEDVIECINHFKFLRKYNLVGYDSKSN